MTEQWIRWEPLQGLSEKYYLDYVIDSYKDGFKIILSDENETKRSVEIHFETGVHAYRNTDESFQLALLCELRDSYNTEFYGYWTFFKVTNSLYTQWISEQSLKSFEHERFKHFCFITWNHVIDVAANYEPKMRFID